MSSAAQPATAKACTRCGSTRVHHSRHRDRTERLLTLFGGQIRRCHQCDFRFLQFGNSKLELNIIKTAVHRTVLLPAAMLAVFIAAYFVSEFLLSNDFNS